MVSTRTGTTRRREKYSTSINTCRHSKEFNRIATLSWPSSAPSWGSSSEIKMWEKYVHKVPFHSEKIFRLCCELTGTWEGRFRRTVHLFCSLVQRNLQSALTCCYNWMNQRKNYVKNFYHSEYCCNLFTEPATSPKNFVEPIVASLRVKSHWKL